MTGGRLHRLKGWRDGVMFGLGAGGFLHELLVAATERETILLGCLALMGLPVWMRADEKRNNGNKNGK